MKERKLLNYFILIYISLFFASCSLYDGIEVPGYIAVAVTVIFLVFVAVWFFRRLKR